MKTGWIRRASRAAGWLLASLVCLACGGASPPPSILIVVLDTTRLDAVSAYGLVEGTTPHLDELAASGLRYNQAYSQANWTLPSHASLFTGLLPSQHGALSNAEPLAKSSHTLAERLRNHGYETMAVSENPWLGHPELGLSQGFERFVDQSVRFGSKRKKINASDMAATVERWLAERSPGRPFLLFLNIMDSHTPYRGAHAASLPAGVTLQEANAVSQRPLDHVCQTGPDSREMEILRALYLAGVRRADEKLGRVLEALRRAGADRNLISVVTSDHGEHLGEQSLFLHDIGVFQPLIHIPLVVHGLRNTAPAVIDSPVQLLDLLPSVLEWAGAPGSPALPGRPLPAHPRSSKAARTIVSEYIDPDRVGTPEMVRGAAQEIRSRCGQEDRVRGDMRAVLRFPHKLIWYADYPSQLFDLGADPDEGSDIAATLPLVAEELERALPPRYQPSGVAAPDLDPEFRDALRALGYLSGPAAEDDASPPRP